MYAHRWMRTTSTAMLLIAVILAVLVPANGISLRGELKSMGGMSEKMDTLNRALTDCASGDIECFGKELQTQMSGIGDLNMAMDTYVKPVDDLLTKFEERRTTMVAMSDTLTMVSLALEAASLIPEIGVVFKVINVGIKVLLKPIKVLKKGMDAVANALILPWQNTVGLLYAAVERAFDALSYVPSYAIAMGSILPNMCVEPTLTSLMPAIKPPLSAFKAGLPSFTQAITDLNGALQPLIRAVNGATFQAIKSKLDKLHVIDSLKKIGDALKGLSKALDTSINLPWISGVRDRTRSDLGCDSNQDQVGLNCFPKCADGYTGVDFVCWRTCATKDVGAACTNPTYVPASRWEHSRVCAPWDCPPIGRVDTWCDSGQTHVGSLCYDNCKSGYDTMTILVRFCAAQCPSGMSRSPEGNFCTKDSYDRKSSALHCKPGSTPFLTDCYESCKSGETEVGTTCFTPSRISLRVRDIFDKLEEIKDTINGLPILDEINKAIEEGVKQILQPFLDVLHLLHVPIPQDLPTIDINLGVLTDFPVQKLLDRVEVAIPPGLDPTAMAAAVNIVKGMIDNVATKLGLPSSWSTCMDWNCLSSALKVPKLDTSAVSAVFKEALQLNSILPKFATVVKGCKTTEVKTLDITNKIASFMKVPANDIVPCSVDFVICKEIDADKAQFTALLQETYGVISKISDGINALVEKVTPTLMQESAKTGARMLSPFDQALPFYSPNNWRSRYTVPLSALFPFSLVKAPFGWRAIIWGKKSQDQLFPVGGYLNIKPTFNVYLEDILNNGGRRLDFSFGVGVEITYFRSEDIPLAITGIYLDGLNSLNEIQEKLPSRCIKSELSRRNNALDFELDPDGQGCKTFVDAANLLNDPSKWDWEVRDEPGPDPKTLFTQYPPGDPYWNTRKGSRRGARLNVFLRELIGRVIESGASLDWSSAGDFVQKNGRYILRALGRFPVWRTTITWPKPADALVPGAFPELCAGVQVRDLINYAGAAYTMHPNDGTPLYAKVFLPSAAVLGWSDKLVKMPITKRIVVSLLLEGIITMHSVTLKHAPSPTPTPVPRNSPDGKFSLIMQGDGNLVLYRSGGHPVWASNTDNNAGATATFQNGNLAVFSSTNAVLWQTNTGNRPFAKLQVENIGVVVIIDNGKTIWSSPFSMTSDDGRFTFVMQSDGNLVLYQQNVGPLWASGTDGNSGAFMAFENGNLVVYSSSLTVLWQSNTSNHPNASLLVQNDGNVVIYDGGKPVWATHTCCK